MSLSDLELGMGGRAQFANLIMQKQCAEIVGEQCQGPNEPKYLEIQHIIQIRKHKKRVESKPDRLSKLYPKISTLHYVIIA
jgi:hypothetical protein